MNAASGLFSRPIEVAALPEPPDRASKRRYKIEIGDEVAAIATVDVLGRGDNLYALQSANITADFGPNVSVPRVFAHLPPGWCESLASSSCTIAEFVDGVGSARPTPENLATILTGLADVYGPCGRLEIIPRLTQPENVRPRRNSLGSISLTDFSEATSGKEPFNAEGWGRLIRVRDLEDVLWTLATADASTIVHGDVWQSNLAVAGSTLALIDWEHSKFGNVGADVAHLWLMSSDLLAVTDIAPASLACLAELIRAAHQPGLDVDAELVSWNRAFDAYVVVEGTRVLWGPLRRSIAHGTPTITGERDRGACLARAELLSDSIRVAGARLGL